MYPRRRIVRDVRALPFFSLTSSDEICPFSLGGRAVRSAPSPSATLAAHPKPKFFLTPFPRGLAARSTRPVFALTQSSASSTATGPRPKKRTQNPVCCAAPTIANGATPRAGKAGLTGPGYSTSPELGDPVTVMVHEPHLVTTRSDLAWYGNRPRPEL